MSIQNISYNPFALSTAQTDWADTTTSLLTKASKTTASAIYDIYIKNPYDLTIGNCKTLINSSIQIATRTKIAAAATIAFGSLYTLMLYGASCHLLGSSLLAVGSASGLSILEKVGAAVQALGTNTFITGAVPIYAMLYALPKKILVSLSILAKIVADKIAIVASWTFHNLIQPTLSVVGDVLRFVGTQIKFVLDILGKTITTIAETTFKYVIKPFFQKVVFPLLHKFGNVIHFAYRSVSSVLEAIGSKVDLAIQWIFKNVVTPFWNHIVFPALSHLGNAIVYLVKGVANVISAVADKVARSATWVIQNLIEPVWKNFLLPALKATGEAFHFVAKLVGEAAQTLGNVTVKVASFIFQKILAPAFNAIAQATVTTGRLLNNYIIKPLTYVLTSIADKVAIVFNAIYEALIVPTALAIASVANFLKERAVEGTTAIHQAFTSAWNRIAFSF